MKNISPLALLPLLAACQPNSDNPAVVDSVSEALELAPGMPVAIPPYSLVQGPTGYEQHGVGGDRVLLFDTQASPTSTTAPTVHVARRLDGRLLGELPAPPGGWLVPLTVHVASFSDDVLRGATSGTLLVLDAVAPPSAPGSAPGKIYEYSYSYDRRAGFQAQLVATRVLPLISPALIPAMFAPPGVARPLPDGVLYPVSFSLLSSGAVVVSDTLAGALWVSDTSRQSFSLAVFDDSLRPGPGTEADGVGRAPGGGVRPYQYTIAGGMYPGVAATVHATGTNELIITRVAPPGGISRISLADLLSTSVAPNAKGGLLHTLVAPQLGLTDAVFGLAYDSFSACASDWVYFQRAKSDDGYNTLRRVSLSSGEVQVVTRNNSVYDWADEISALPPEVPLLQITTIFSSQAQEENNPFLNVNLGGQEAYVAPQLWPLTVVLR